jgi:transcriptional regulator with XRE-family HTH domain
VSGPGDDRIPDLRTRLREELARRRSVNRRYSLRAFGAFLDVDHSTLSQILRGRRPIPIGALGTWAARLGLGPQETEIYRAVAMAENPAALKRRVQEHHWLGEAAEILGRPAHWRLLALLREPDFRADMRWVAARLELGADELNDAFARLLRLGLLRVEADGTWRDATGLPVPSEQAVKELALARARLAQDADA